MIEVSKFRLKSERGEEEFLSKNAAFQEQFAYQQAGLIRRTAARGLNGEWVSITWWRSMGDARRASSEASTSMIAQELESLIDTDSKRVEYFKELPG